jgi:hypothetical protein
MDFALRVDARASEEISSERLKKSLLFFETLVFLSMTLEMS